MDIARSCMAVALLGVLAPSPALAQACTATIAPEGVLAPWTAPVPLAAAPDAGSAGAAALAPGEAARASLIPRSRVTFAAPPGKSGDAASYGGMFTIAVPQPGTYRVALGSAGWVDLVRAGEAIASTAHGHGPECTGIRKMVDFPLDSGTHLVQVAASPDAETTILVVRLP